VIIKSESTMPDDIRHQKGMDEVAQIASNLLVQAWLTIDKMLPEHLEPIRDGLKRRRTRSSQGTGLTTNFMMFLCAASVLHQNGNMTMGDLTRATSMPKSTTTRMVNWMVEKGYVDRFEDAKDRRVVRVRLTVSGVELLLAAKEQFRELSAKIMGRLPAIQRAAFLSILTDLISAWQSVQKEQNGALLQK